MPQGRLEKEGMGEWLLNTICKCSSQTKLDSFVYALFYLEWGSFFFLRERVWLFPCALGRHISRQNRELVVCVTLGCTRSVLLAIL